MLQHVTFINPREQVVFYVFSCIEAVNCPL